MVLQTGKILVPHLQQEVEQVVDFGTHQKTVEHCMGYVGTSE